MDVQSWIVVGEYLLKANGGAFNDTRRCIHAIINRNCQKSATFTDLELSRELNTGFKLCNRVFGTVVEIVDVDVQVLTSGSWPQYVNEHSGQKAFIANSPLNVVL